ncbi:MAG: hypothetical protein ACYTXA_21285 [Nostoc sp.]
MNARECQKPQITNDLPHLWLVDSQGFFDIHLTSKLDSLAYSYFQVNRPPGKGTAMLCPYDRCGSNT